VKHTLLQESGYCRGGKRQRSCVQDGTQASELDVGVRAETASGSKHKAMFAVRCVAT